nr:MAG TPA: hypothetical protein [Caudoviricetes sp.]
MLLLHYLLLPFFLLCKVFFFIYAYTLCRFF